MAKPMREKLLALLRTGETDRDTLVMKLYDLKSDCSERMFSSKRSNFSTILKLLRNDGAIVEIRRNYVKYVEWDREKANC